MPSCHASSSIKVLAVPRADADHTLGMPSHVCRGSSKFVRHDEELQQRYSKAGDNLTHPSVSVMLRMRVLKTHWLINGQGWYVDVA